VISVGVPEGEFTCGKLTQKGGATKKGEKNPCGQSHLTREPRLERGKMIKKRNFEKGFCTGRLRGKAKEKKTATTINSKPRRMWSVRTKGLGEMRPAGG